MTSEVELKRRSMPQTKVIKRRPKGWQEIPHKCPKCGSVRMVALECNEASESRLRCRHIECDWEVDVNEWEGI